MLCRWLLQQMCLNSFFNSRLASLIERSSCYLGASAAGMIICCAELLTCCLQPFNVGSPTKHTLATTMDGQAHSGVSRHGSCQHPGHHSKLSSSFHIISNDALAVSVVTLESPVWFADHVIHGCRMQVMYEVAEANFEKTRPEDAEPSLAKLQPRVCWRSA